jgi:hypothetical protein
LASTRDCHDDPHRRSHTGGAHSSSRLAPLSPTPVVPVMNLTARVGVPQPKTAPERFVRSGSLAVADGLVGRSGVAGQACLTLPNSTSIAWRSRMPAAISQRMLATASLIASFT